VTLNGGRLELLNKIRSGVRTLAFFSVLFFAAPAAAIEITAIDFNGDLIGKVIPDGKVVSLDNQLIGNVTADSLIVNFDGELIGGVIPQGIAIGNDNKPLGKVNNDGSVRLASGKIIAKVLPNGLVVDDFFNITGAVLFPGLVYSDDGRTVGRLTGEQHGAGYVEKVINNQAVRQHFCNNLSRSQTNGAVVIYFTERFIVVADGNALRNNAADKLAVKINNQAVGGNIADKLIVETDNLTVGNNLAYKIAVEVDGRNFNCRGRSSKKQHGEKGKCPHTRPDFIQKF
jgi:hypothetical protein